MRIITAVTHPQPGQIPTPRTAAMVETEDPAAVVAVRALAYLRIRLALQTLKRTAQAEVAEHGTTLNCQHTAKAVPEGLTARTGLHMGPQEKTHRMVRAALAARMEAEKARTITGLEEPPRHTMAAVAVGMRTITVLQHRIAVRRRAIRVSHMCWCL